MMPFTGNAIKAYFPGVFILRGRQKATFATSYVKTPDVDEGYSD